MNIELIITVFTVMVVLKLIGKAIGIVGKLIIIGILVSVLYPYISQLVH